MHLFYTISIQFYCLCVWVISPFYSKAAIWLKNREEWDRILEQLKPGKKNIWIHAASAGEFEQAIPVIEEIRRSWTDVQIAVSFYSASGYDLYKNTNYADLYFYLPSDLPKNAEVLLTKLNPAVAIFIRNEIWWNILTKLNERNIPAILINAEPQNKSGIYGWYLKICYACFTRIFYANSTGNTKLERARSIAETNYNNSRLENFSKNNFVLLLGSCYEKEVQLSAAFYTACKSSISNLKIIFCPHEWNEKTLSDYQKYFSDKIERYSENPASAKLLFVDEMGILKYLYRYANAAFIGGGFGKGVHNVSEAGIYGIPVLIGPNYEKFPETSAMVKNGLVSVVTQEADIKEKLHPFIMDITQSVLLKEKWKQYFDQSGHASILICKEIEKMIRK